MLILIQLIATFSAIVNAQTNPTEVVREPMVACGGTHTIALKIDGTVWAWGDNTYGQLGLGMTSGDKTTPQQVKFFKDSPPGGTPVDKRVIAVAAGEFHSMALTHDGKVYVWGRNNNGQIGNGSSTGNVLIPYEISTCRVVAEPIAATPVFVDAGATPKFIAIAAGGNHCLALAAPRAIKLGGVTTPSGSKNWQYVFTWGLNDRGQLGTGDQVKKLYPTSFDFLGYESQTKRLEFLGVAGGDNTSGLSFREYATASPSTQLYYGLDMTGDNAYEQNFSAFNNNPQLRWIFGLNQQYLMSAHLGTGHAFMFAERMYSDEQLQADPNRARFHLYGNGANAQGQVGMGIFSTKTFGYPIDTYSGVGTLAGMKQLASGANHLLARLADGSLYVWGNNTNGTTVFHSLGLAGLGSATADHNRPRLNTNLSNVAYVAAGGRSSFGVKFDGTVYGWGTNGNGQLGVPGGAVTAKGVPTALEIGNTNPPTYFTLWSDADNDKMPDEWEALFGGISLTPNGDADGDGVTNLEEWRRHLNPIKRDTDGDGFNDGYEIANPRFLANAPDMQNADYDSDGLKNLQEMIRGTDQAQQDSDGDGVMDGPEVAAGSDPMIGGGGGNTPLPDSELLEMDITVADANGTPEGREKYRAVVYLERSNGTSSVVGVVEMPGYSGDATGRVKVPRGSKYSITFELVDTDEGDGGTGAESPDGRYYGSVTFVKGGEGYKIEDPSSALDQAQFPGPTAFIVMEHQPDACEQPAYLTSVSEASGPSYRKIALNGLPLPDSKPQAKDETDQEREETFIDALTQQLRHSTTDIYVPLVGGELALSARRDVAPEVWGTHPGISPDQAVNKPFGQGWTTNLCPHIEFIYYVKNTPASTCVAERPQPDLVLVTDENGSTHRFIRVWKKGQGIIPEEAFLPYPSNRNESESFLTSLTKDGATGIFTFRKKFGTTVTYEMTSIVRQYNTNPDPGGPTDQVIHAYARAKQAKDRLGNKLDYEPSTDSLIPAWIKANGNRTIVIGKQPGPTGKITSVTDPRTFATSYGYTTKSYADPYRGNVSYSVLSSVTTPENTVTQYGYEQVGPEWDWTPIASGSDPYRWEFFFHSNLSSITDPNAKTTNILYAMDASRHSYSTKINTYYAVPGQPRVVKQVAFPLLTGEGLAAFALFENESDVRIGYQDGHPILLGQRRLKVTDTASTFTEPHVRTYEFLNPVIFEQDEFENIVFQTNDQRSTPFLVLYTQLKITHPAIAGVAKSETFNFDPAAGMALSQISDFSGNVTLFEHADQWTMPPHLSWIPAGYYTGKYTDPTTQTNARAKSKKFKYSPERVMKEIEDEEGRRTVYDVQPVTGLRTAERIYSPAPENALIQETKFDYENPTFPAFLTRKTVKRQTSDPAWAIDLITEYEPDANGYVFREKVRSQTTPTVKWLITENVYDANGNRTQVKDPRLNITDFTYDKLNRLRFTTYPPVAGVRHTRELRYDNRGNKTVELDERNYATLYNYDEWSRLKKQARDMDGDLLFTPADLTTEYGYNRVGSRMAVKDPRGYTTTTYYDALQRPVQLLNAKLEPTNLYYDGPNVGASAFDISGFKPTRTLDARGYETIVEYDVLYRAIKQTAQYQKAPLPDLYSVTETEYDEVGNPVRIWDPLNPKDVAGSYPVETKYDALNRPIKVTLVLYLDNNNQPAFVFTQAKWTATGLKWQAIDERNYVTETQYDGAGRPIKVIAPGVPDENGVLQPVGPVTQTVYDDVGNIKQIINAKNKVWDYEYDTRNRKTDEYAPAVPYVGSPTPGRPRTQWGFDPAGNVNATTTPNGHKTDIRFDRANRPYEVEAPLVSYWTGTASAQARPLTKTFYDRNGNVETVTDADNRTTTNTYDALNRLKTTTDAENLTVTYDYDAAGNRTLVTDGKIQSTTFEYDGLKRLTKQKDALNRSTLFEYNELNRTARVDAQLRRTEYDYNRRHQVTGIRYYAPDGTVVDNTVNAWRTYSHDFSGNLTTVSEPAKNGHSVFYGYDGLNRITVEFSGDNGWLHRNNYRYDAVGNLRYTVYLKTNRTVQQTFDDANRLQTVADGQATTLYGYDLNGNVVTRTLGNGNVTTLGYDALNRVTSSNVSTTAGGATFQGYEHIHDLTGNVRFITESYQPNTARNRTLQLTYDGAYRLKEEKVINGGTTVTTTYGYDAAHNRTSKVVSGGPGVGTWTYIPNSLNQITSFSGPGTSATLAYDFDGNRTSLSGTGSIVPGSYTYDYENRLVATTAGGQQNFAYDYRDQRVKRTVNGTTDRIIFSGGVNCLEVDDVTQAVKVEYIRGRDLGGGIGGMLTTIRNGGTDRRYIHNNPRGDIVAETDAVGQVLYSAAYEAFGKRPDEVGTTPNRQKANSKEEDPSGLLNEGHRYRDLTTGTFITRDPAGFVDGPNLYTYVRQNPWSKFDPEGLEGATVAPPPAPIVTEAEMKAAVDALKPRGSVSGNLGGALAPIAGTLSYGAQVHTAARQAGGRIASEAYHSGAITAEQYVTIGEGIIRQKLPPVGMYQGEAQRMINSTQISAAGQVGDAIATNQATKYGAPSPSTSAQETKKEADVAVHRIGGGDPANFQLSERDKKGPKWGLSVLLGGTPQSAATQMREAFPAATGLQEKSNLTASSTLRAITGAGFTILPSGSEKLPNHAVIQHPGGVAGYEANAAKLAPIFSTTPTPP